jgi:hypothetical protein
MRRTTKRLLAAASVGAALAAAGAVQAATFTYSADFTGGVGAEWAISTPQNSGAAGILGELGGGNSSATLSKSSVGASAANAGTLTFDLLGFRTIDGTNGFDDVFNLIINGSTVFQATFAMGGGGGNAVYIDTNGATVSGAGNSRSFVVPFTVLAGANTFQFAYNNLQSFGDEAFGLDNVSLNATVADPTGGIPEPSTWAMMILGFGAAGTAMRSRRRAALA